MSVSKTKTRRRWIDMGNGHRRLPPTPAAAAAHREWMAAERKTQARIQADTCGLGNWKQPESWDRTPFSHTVTTVEGLSCGMDAGWNIYNGGVVVALVVQSPDECFARGGAYVWCKTIRETFGGGTHPTAPIFGRFIEKDRSGRPIALVGRGKSLPIDEKHDQCFRAVGRVGFGSEFYPRSEVPVPIPCTVVRHEQPMHFEAVQDYLHDLDRVLEAAVHVTELVEELDNAEKAGTGKIDIDLQRWRRARAFQALCPIIAEALSWQTQTRQKLEDFMAASPSLAYWLKGLQAERVQKAGA